VLFMLVLAPQHVGQDSCHWPFTLTQPGRRLKVPSRPRRREWVKHPAFGHGGLEQAVGTSPGRPRALQPLTRQRARGGGGDVAQWLSGTTNTFLECVLPTEPRTGVLNIHVSRGQ
jgi:hypothetical protein